MSSWPPTPDPPSTIADAEATLRSGAPGPPPFGDDDPWDFIHRWPDDIVATLVWPAVSRLLEDGDAEVRERAICFAKRWPIERPRSLERLIEVATQHAPLYRAASQADTLASGLADLSSAVREEEPRVAKVILALLGDAPPCGSGVSLLAEYEPAELIERAPKWTEHYVDQSAAVRGATAMALYQPDHLIELLAAVSSRSDELRTEILTRLEPMLAVTDEHRAMILNAEGVALPQRPCPTLSECRAAIGLR